MDGNSAGFVLKCDQSEVRDNYTGHLTPVLGTETNYRYNGQSWLYCPANNGALVSEDGTPIPLTLPSDE